MKVRRFGALALLLSLAYVSTAQADEQISKEAREHFNAGVAFVDDPDGARFEEAYREFKAAYAISPSWKILGNLGLVALKLERDGEAIAAYTQYLALGGAQLDAGERKQVERDLQLLKSGVVSFTASSTPGGATLSDERLPDAGQVVVNRYALGEGEVTLGLRPGRHRLTAHLDGYRDAVWTLDATSGKSASFVFQLEKLEQEQAPRPDPARPSPIESPRRELVRPVPASVFILGGISVALAGGGVVTGLMAKSKRDSYDEMNKSLTSENQEAATKQKEDGQRLNLIADSLFAGAVIGAGVTVALYLTRPSVERELGRLQLLPLLGPRVGGAALTGSF